jgi:hypothetical protein
MRLPPHRCCCETCCCVARFTRGPSLPVRSARDPGLFWPRNPTITASLCPHEDRRIQPHLRWKETEYGAQEEGTPASFPRARWPTETGCTAGGSARAGSKSELGTGTQGARWRGVQPRLRRKPWFGDWTIWAGCQERPRRGTTVATEPSAQASGTLGKT